MRSLTHTTFYCHQRWSSSSLARERERAIFNTIFIKSHYSLLIIILLVRVKCLQSIMFLAFISFQWHANALISLVNSYSCVFLCVLSRPLNLHFNIGRRQVLVVSLNVPHLWDKISNICIHYIVVLYNNHCSVFATVHNFPISLSLSLIHLDEFCKMWI